MLLRFAPPTAALAALSFALVSPESAYTQAASLDDAEIAHIAVTANAIDAELAQIAQGRAVNEEVRQFAATMIRDHTGVNEQAKALAARLGVTPADNEVSRSLRSGAEAARQKLENIRGGEFDIAYMQREVEYHEAVLAALDQTLIPNSTNEELKALLQQARGAVAAHLEHARHLRRELAGR